MKTLARPVRGITSRTIAHIYRKLELEPMVRMSRGGIKMQFSYEYVGFERPKTKRVKWRARIRKIWTAGIAADVTDAIRAIAAAQETIL